MYRKTAALPMALVAACAIGCQSSPPTGSLAEIKREQEKRLFSECVSDHRVLWRGSTNYDYSVMRVALIKDCRTAADARVW
jgi:hypothetical protein